MSDLVKRLNIKADMIEWAVPKVWGGDADLMREAARKIEAMQAKIDSLMFEYCPDDMTEDQIKNFEQHQGITDI